MAKKDEKKELESIHEIVLRLYAEFQKICKRKSLRYIAISGTTIGAALWQGIIPWDDDMDIAMPAEDYLEFVKCCKKNLPSGIGIEEYPWFGCKIFDKNTTFTDIHYVTYPERYCGVFIDIVPLIGVPDNEEDFCTFKEDYLKFRRVAMMADRYGSDNGYNKKEIAEWRKRILLGVDFEKAIKVMDFSDPRYVLEASGFQNPIEMKFENNKIYVSSNWDADLKIQYGKYQKYPDKSKRVRLHDMEGIFSLEKSTRDSATILEKMDSVSRDILEKRIRLEGIYFNQMLLNEERIRELEKEKKALLDSIDEIKKSRLYRVISKISRIYKRR